LRGDRRFAVVLPSGAKVDAQVEPGLLHLTAEASASGGVRLRDGHGESLDVVPDHSGEVIAVEHSRQGTALAVSAEADAWLSTRLGRSVRLVWQPDPRVRSIRPDLGGQPGETLSLADAGPLLLVNEASLRQLNEWVAEHEPTAAPLSRRRFRPNVVVDGDDAAPFAEDGWATVTLGEVTFRTTMVCDRCSVTMIDPVTLASGKEPIRTLARHRRWEGKTWFGVRLVPLGPGVLRVGDLVVPQS
jgi:uncharacterized protein YcbX